MGTPVLQMTRDEIAYALESSSRDRLGMSAPETIRAYWDRRLADPAEIADLLALVRLLRDDDPLIAAARA